jgi:hypothetical protein
VGRMKVKGEEELENMVLPAANDVIWRCKRNQAQRLRKNKYLKIQLQERLPIIYLEDQLCLQEV